MDADDTLLPDRRVRERYGVSEMTIWRWDNNPALGFPDAIRINGRKYRRLRQLQAWERAAQHGPRTKRAAGPAA